jgi:hypothetical protein
MPALLEREVLVGLVVTRLFRARAWRHDAEADPASASLRRQEGCTRELGALGICWIATKSRLRGAGTPPPRDTCP